jgi:chromosome segregation ATPase
MTDEPENATIRILQQIQATLADHTQRFERVDQRFENMQQQLDHRFDRVDREITDLLDNTIKSSGAASISLVRHENVQKQFAEMELELRELRSRLRKLEEKV